jgi:6-hydroxycyclohex-1-ene-1-carbonyl-CoA dehydrogenase
MRQLRAWQMTAANAPFVKKSIPIPNLEDDQALVKIAGCGVCHTDLGFYYEGIRTNKPAPLTLGHEVSGIVEEAGRRFQHLIGKAAVVPAVLPCGECELCKKGLGTICRKQQMPGNDIDGGFASHIIVPAKPLCVFDATELQKPSTAENVTLAELSVIADAVTTPYQAIVQSGLQGGELAIFVGVGGIGGFGVQIAKAKGAQVIAIDIDDERLQFLRGFGADATFNAKSMGAKEIRDAIREVAKQKNCSLFEWKIFETSGTTAGQELAFSLLTHGSTLSVVGFTMERLNLRLSNLMAFHARALGNWGCLPEHYPAVLDLTLSGAIAIKPFVQTFPLSSINQVFADARAHRLKARPVLAPDFLVNSNQ